MACSIKIESHDKKDISSIDTSCKGKITLLITTHTRCLTTCDSFYKDKYISVNRKKYFVEPNMQNLLFHIDVRILCNRLNEHNLSNQSNLTLNQMQLRECDCECMKAWVYAQRRNRPSNILYM